MIADLYDEDEDDLWSDMNDDGERQVFDFVKQSVPAVGCSGLDPIYSPNARSPGEPGAGCNATLLLRLAVSTSFRLACTLSVQTLTTPHTLDVKNTEDKTKIDETAVLFFLSELA